MTDTIFDISIINLVIAYIFVLILIFIVKNENIGHEKQIIIASFRMTVQLVLVGYVLTYVFENPNPYITILILMVMEVFAIFNIYSRVESKLSSNLKVIIGISMFGGTLASILFFLFIVINIEPWFMPQYFIPISGMLIGNSMTGISLGAQGLITGINDNKERIENALMLGATPEKATKDIQNRSFYNAVLPTINSMIGMGIVFLPGMMTGQILAGAAPLTAIKYQIAIMMGILGSVTLTVYLMVKWGMKSFFNERAQIHID
ncbi:MAG TPA: iron export ABC transporter permease subunit FetB [Halanaerobiales bacterium]|nr:iron export ABC transporter permease subunit FetB [Halanaerobiales bacterium]